MSACESHRGPTLLHLVTSLFLLCFQSPMRFLSEEGRLGGSSVHFSTPRYSTLVCSACQF